MFFLLNGLYKYSEVYELVHNLTAIVDVSGYALATHFKSARTIPLTQMASYHGVGDSDGEGIFQRVRGSCTPDICSIGVENQKGNSKGFFDRRAGQIEDQQAETDE